MLDLTFDPNSLGQKTANIYGLPFDLKTSKIAIIPVPWEVTVSYNAGTAKGPEAILQASYQVDLFDSDLDDAWKIGLAMAPIPESIKELNDQLRPQAEAYIKLLEGGEKPQENKAMAAILDKINGGCVTMNDWVQSQAKTLLDQGKVVGLVGGDHSTPLGLIRELASRHKEFGILHFDAHADLRDAYEGFTYSHASIMFNVIKEKSLSKLIQVGIRDYCQMEADLIANSAGRIETLFDKQIQRHLFAGESWHSICQEVIDSLPENVYVSFDIDGLDPKLCPHTGTPVPGGLEFEQALYLVLQLVESGRRIIGFDLNEVAPGLENSAGSEWDANVGARLLYRLANLTARSNRLSTL